MNSAFALAGLAVALWLAVALALLHTMRRYGSATLVYLALLARVHRSRLF